MSDLDKKSGVPGSPEPVRPEPSPEGDPEVVHEEEIARLLRLAGLRPAAGPESTQRVRTAVHARWRVEIRARRYRRLIPWIAIPMAAAAAGVAMIALARWLPRPTPEVGPNPLAILERAEGPLRRSDGGSVLAGAEFPLGTDISTGAGGRAALKLSAGASLRLDSDTTLRLVSGTVLDLEQGAVYLDSGGARGAAVAVRTPAGTVRDVGTQFEVRLGESSLRVTVREGAAYLRLGPDDLEIQAGTRLAAGPRGEISRTKVTAHDPDWDWVLKIAPPISLEDRTLGAFLAWVSRETGWQVRFADTATAQERASIVLHGSLDGLRPDEAPAAILPTCGLTSHLEGGVLVIEPLDALEGSP